ncbi:hypothetical protein COU60_03630 [Candidatus Pacearchaeota archaeon CG10_big_fil_rev_8_21_14_0_10_34_76]|nr:MAG: hypothetical protein COU60_03630 [Candidatus Pacearchaeota archaeon CG10_big_fil_rev_8_21_14_0_10_34_76]
MPFDADYPEEQVSNINHEIADLKRAKLRSLIYRVVAPTTLALGLSASAVLMTPPEKSSFVEIYYVARDNLSHLESLGDNVGELSSSREQMRKFVYENSENEEVNDYQNRLGHHKRITNVFGTWTIVCAGFGVLGFAHHQSRKKDYDSKILNKEFKRDSIIEIDDEVRRDYGW